MKTRVKVKIKIKQPPILRIVSVPHWADDYEPVKIGVATSHPVGSLARLRVMRLRVARGELLRHPDDNKQVGTLDECRESKQFADAWFTSQSRLERKQNGDPD